MQLVGPATGRGDRYAKDSEATMTGLGVKEMSLGRTLPVPTLQTSLRTPLGDNLPCQDGRGGGKVGAGSRFRGNGGTPVWVRGHGAQGDVKGNQWRNGHFLYRRDQGAKEPPSKAAWRAGQASTGKAATRHNKPKTVIDCFRDLSTSGTLWATETKV